MTPECLFSPVSAATSTCSGSSNDSFLIPDHWQPEVEVCIKDKSVDPSAHIEIVRTLVTQLFSKSSKPTRAQCEEGSRKLILKYPFLKDDMGNGYVSS